MGLNNKYRRLQLLADPRDVPTQTEVRCQLGSPLADVFFTSVYSPCRKYLGLEPLQGVVESQLWMSPSDILIGKVLMTPPMPTRRVVRALTHQGIMEIGERCLRKIENECHTDKQQALVELKAHMTAVARQEQEAAVRLAREEERLLFDRQLEDIYAQCRLDIKNSVHEAALETARQTAALVQVERQEVHDLMYDQMAGELQAQEHIMVKQFNRHLEETVREINNYFRENMRVTMEESKWRLSLEVYRNQQYVTLLRYQMQAQQQIDISYITCRERQRCHDDKHRMRLDFHTQLAAMTKIMDRKIVELELSQRRADTEAFRSNFWHSRVGEIVSELQKFVDFALKATPGQAEFLLSLEKLLVMKIAKKEAEVIQDTDSVVCPEPVTVTETSVTYVIPDEKEMSIHDYQLPATVSAVDCVEHVLAHLIDQAIPPNTELQEIIGGVLEALVNNTVPLGTDVVTPILEALLRVSTPAPEQEQIAEWITDCVIRLTLPMPEQEVIVASIVKSMMRLIGHEDDMVDAGTQVPSLEQCIEEEETDLEIIDVGKQTIQEEKVIRPAWMSCAWCEVINNNHLVCQHDRKPAQSETWTQTECRTEDIEQIATSSMTKQSVKQSDQQKAKSQVQQISSEESEQESVEEFEQESVEEFEQDTDVKFQHKYVQTTGSIPSEEIEEQSSEEIHEKPGRKLEIEPHKEFQPESDPETEEARSQELGNDRVGSLLRLFQQHPSLTATFIR